MSAISVTVSGESPTEVASRLRGLADALAPRPSATPSATTVDTSPPTPKGGQKSRSVTAPLTRPR